MARIASTTTAGVPVGPVGGMTLDALMERAKEAAARQGEIAAPRQIRSPWQGAAQMMQAFTNARQGAYAEDQATQARQQLVQLLSGVDPEKGADSATAAQIYALDPAAGQRAMETAAQIVRERRQRMESVQDREDTQAFGTSERVAGQEFTGGQGDLNRGQQVTLQEDQQAAQVERDKEAARVAAETAAQAAKVDAAKPGSGQAKIMADYNNGIFGTPGSLEANTRRDQALAKENAIAGPTTIFQNGDSGDLLKKFNQTLGEKVIPQYMREAATAGGLMRGMEVLDQIDPNVQGPLVGRLAEMFPGVDSQASLFQSIVKRLAPAQREEGSGSTSDIEYAGMLASLPSLINNPAANRAISAAVKAQAQIAIERGNLITQWQSQKIDQQTLFEKLNELNSRSILSPELAKMIEATQSNAPVDVSGGGDDPEGDALVKKWSQ